MLKQRITICIPRLFGEKQREHFSEKGVKENIKEIKDNEEGRGGGYMNVLVSMCLLGTYCRYSGERKEDAGVLSLLKKEGLTLIPVCPEQLGGLPTPRLPAEQKDGRVFDKGGTDRTEEFEKGAREVLRLAKLYGCKAAVLKERSPSCGSNVVYDGSFGGVRVPGDGVCAGLLKRNGIAVFGESETKELLRFLEETGQEETGAL